MDLIYYYPLGVGAPSNVARNVFKHLLKRRKELPFEKIMLYVPTRDIKEVSNQFSEVEVITRKNLSSISKNSIIHIPVSPLIYPNSKFLLHLFTILKNRKLILHYHGDIRKEMQLQLKHEHSFNISYILTYILLPLLLKSADKLIVNSYFMSNTLRAMYGVKNEVVIPNGIDNFWFEETNETNIIFEGDPTFLYHGRLSPEKGVDLLIKGFAEAINHKKSKAKLYIIGEGSQRAQLEKLCVKLGIQKNITFLGYINLKDLRVYFKSVDAAIYPSIYEPFSLAVLEAFSSVKGVVYFSKVAGIHDFVVRDGYNLCAFEPRVENISEIIKEIIDENYDKRIVKQQNQFARRYTWDKVINYYIDLYTQILVV